MNSRRLPVAYRESALANDFLRGLVTTGLLASVQERGRKPRIDRRTARLALQGGSALAAGSAAARAWQQGRKTAALSSVTLGVAAVLSIECLLQDKPAKEKHDGQEKAQKRC